MKLGLIARCDNTGLGNLTWEFYKHINPDRVLLMDIMDVKGMASYPERYPDAFLTSGINISESDIIKFLTGLDIVYTAETPYRHYLIHKAHELGVKVVTEYMYEFLNEMNQELPLPDVFIAPSLWNIDKVKAKFGDMVKYIPTPVNRELCRFKLRPKAKTFLHIAGNRAMEDRNGTEIFLKAIPLVKSDVKFIIKTQSDIDVIKDKRVIIDNETNNYWEMYNADVIVMPRRFGGLCLPLNEAMSCGLVPIMPDISPQNEFLDPESLIPVCDATEIITANPIQCYDIEPSVLAEKIDEFANKDMTRLSMYSDFHAESIGWENEKYTKLFKELIYG